MKKETQMRYICNAYSSRGLLFELLGKFENALSDFKKLRHYSQNGKRELLAELSIIRVLSTMGQYDKAMKKLDEVKTIIDKNRVLHRNNYLLYLRIKVHILHYRCQYEEAMKILDGYLSKAQKNIDTDLKDLKAVNYAVQAKYDKAIDIFQELCSIYKRTKRQDKHASVLRNMGNSFSCLGNFEKAIEYYEKSNKINEKISAKPSLFHTYYNLSGTYYFMRDILKAKDHGIKALQIAEEIGDLSSMTYGYYGLAKLNYNTLDIDKAIEYYQKCLETNKRTRMPTMDIYVSIGMAEIYFYKNADYVKTEKMLVRALSISESINSPEFLLDSLQHFILFSLMKNKIDPLDEMIKKYMKLSEEYKIPTHYYYSRSFFIQYIINTEKDVSKVKETLAALLNEFENINPDFRTVHFYLPLLQCYSRIKNISKFNLIYQELEATEFEYDADTMQKYYVLLKYSFDPDKKKKYLLLLQELAQKYSLKHYLNEIKEEEL